MLVEKIAPNRRSAGAHGWEGKSLNLSSEQLGNRGLGTVGLIPVDQVALGCPVHSGHVLNGCSFQGFLVFLLRQGLNFFRQGFQSRFLGTIAQRAGNSLAVILES